MKIKTINKVLLGALSLLFVIGGLTGCQSKADDSSASEDSEVITIYAATGGSPKPFAYVDEDDNLVGHNIELLEAIFEKLPQYKLEIETTDFTSIFAGLDSDRYQIGVNNFAKNEERQEKYLFSDSIFSNQYVAIVAPGSTEFDTVERLADFAGKSFIGSTAVNSTTAVENYNAANPDDEINITYTEEDLVKQIQDVEDGKYDFLIIDKPMYESYNKEYNFNLKELELSSTVSTSVMEEPYSYLLIAKGNEQLVEEINKALKEVIEEGTSKKINEKYFGEDYTPEIN